LLPRFVERGPSENAGRLATRAGPARIDAGPARWWAAASTVLVEAAVGATVQAREAPVAEGSARR